MTDDKKLKNLIKKQINFDNVSVEFKVEFRDRKNKKVYVLTENEEDYQLERKIGNKSFRTDLNSIEELKDQENLSDEDKEIFSKLFERLNNKQVDKISIGGLRLRNQILSNSIAQPILANVSNKMSKEQKKELYILWKRDKKEEFRERLYEIVKDLVTQMLTEKLAETDDLPSSIFPTSIAVDKAPNYYIFEPPEAYTLSTKIELFNKLANSICGRCGQSIYGLYVSEEWVKEILKEDAPDFYNVDIVRISGVLKGKKRNEELRRFRNQNRPFEYLFYFLDKVLQEMYRRNIIPEFHVELFVIEGVGGGKKFFSHYIIPNLNEIFYKLYHGDDKYYDGISKIKHLISSFLVENWNIDDDLKKNNSERAHARINRLLYHIFCHKRLDMDSILFLEDLKIKLGDSTPILFLEEVILWM